VYAGGRERHGEVLSLITCCHWYLRSISRPCPVPSGLGGTFSTCLHSGLQSHQPSFYGCPSKQRQRKIIMFCLRKYPYPAENTVSFPTFCKIACKITIFHTLYPNFRATLSCQNFAFAAVVGLRRDERIR